ncbi:MAG: Gfo/Idh/MocA family oxidoreductase, partial [Planctomycetales bacterium]|nr:Gfo/Idh/MocA family oxidoreductase [Planctomycetales bacterium]
MRVGIAGIGFMGWIHWLAYQQTDKATVAAIASRDPKKRSGDWTGIQGNFGPPGAQVDLGGVTAYETLDELVADPAIDLVDICLPPHLHRAAVEKSLAAGKHVLCEKPLALTPEDCDAMVAAADAAGRQLLVGQVLPWFPEYTKALEVIDSGEYGKPLGGIFKRIISDPTWISDFYDPTTVGGPLIDLHVHDAHLIRVIFGMPTSVHCAARLRGDVVEYCNTLFQFDDPQVVVSAASGVIHQQGRPFTHGFEIHLERATLQFELAVAGGEGKVLMPLTLFGPGGETQQLDVASGDDVRAFVCEIEEA